MGWRALAVAALVGAGSLLAGCGSDASGVSGKAVRVLYEPAPPASILNLEVSPEDISTEVRSVGQQYFGATALYSLRGDGVAQATLQISRFNAAARPGDEKFREAIVLNLGGTAGLPVRLGEETVYITTGARQSVASWFRGKEMFVLTTRAEYEQPRSLLRAALEVGK